MPNPQIKKWNLGVKRKATFSNQCGQLMLKIIGLTQVTRQEGSIACATFIASVA